MNIELISRNDLNSFKSELLVEINQLINSKKSSLTKEFLTGKDVRELLGISTGTLQNWRIRGKLTYSKIDGKIYYAYEDIQKLIEDNKRNSLSKDKDGQV